jgi:hypothetical protein
MWALFVCAALAQDAPFQPPAIPTPSDPGQDLSPYESRLTGVGVSGSEGRFDLEGLSYVKTQFTITADLSTLEQITAAKRDRFLRHVAADPRWRLGTRDGALVAFKRRSDADRWTVPLRGYHESETDAWRAALRFTPWMTGAPWMDSPLISEAAATDPKIRLAVFTLDQRRDFQAVAMRWKGEHITYELYEAGRQVEDLPRTVSELSALPTFLTLANLSSVDKVGYSTAAMPKGGVATGEPRFELTAAPNGQLDLHGWVHVPGRGITWARILDTDLQPWEAAAVAIGTREIIGWNDDPESLFFMQGQFPVAAGPRMSASVEIWHQPDGGEPLRIGAFPITVPQR